MCCKSYHGLAAFLHIFSNKTDNNRKTHYAKTEVNYGIS